MTKKVIKTAGIWAAGLLAFAGTIHMTKAEPVSDYDSYVFSIAEDYVNVRETADDESTIVGKFYNSSIGEITGQEGDWYLISSGSVSGYVKSDYVVTGAAAEDIAQEALNHYAVVDTEVLYLRSEPDTESEILDALGAESKYQVLEDAGEWIKVAVNGQEGYLHSAYVEEQSNYEEAVSLEEEALMVQSSLGSTMADYALQFVGNPYVWGGTSLTNGADCSGFVQAVYAQFGYGLPRTSGAQAADAAGVSESEMQAGDLIFYASGGSVNHVALYIGDGQVVHASNSKNGIIVSNYNYRTPVKIGRYL